MEELQRSQASHKTHRAHLTRVYKKINEIIQKGVNLKEPDIVVLTNSLEQLERKRRIINEFDTKIAGVIQIPEELEAEVLEAEETLETLSEKIT